MSDRKQLIKLEDSELWQHAQKIAKIMLEICENLPEDERISMGYRMRSTIYNLTCDVTELVSAISYRDAEYPLGGARKNIFSLKNSYKFLGIQDILTIDPDVMVLIDGFTSKLDAEVTDTWKNIDTHETEMAEK